MDILDRDDLSHDGMRFHCVTQNSTQFKNYGLFLEFSIYYFWTVVDYGKLKPQRGKLWMSRDYCICIPVGPHLVWGN